jgi:hypothetical protein
MPSAATIEEALHVLKKLQDKKAAAKAPKPSRRRA